VELQDVRTGGLVVSGEKDVLRIGGGRMLRVDENMVIDVAKRPIVTVSFDLYCKVF
jgi:hypothetical protein